MPGARYGTHLWPLASRAGGTRSGTIGRVLPHRFGCRETWSEEGWIEVTTPGAHDIISFRSDLPDAGRSAGIVHFGFRLRDPADIDSAVDAAKAAGARIKERGEFSPGQPYAFIEDPDGYEVEIWFE